MHYSLNDISGEIRMKILHLLLSLKEIDPEDDILIFGDPRGGTTWLLELLMHIPRTAVIWEPSHVTLGVMPPSFRFGWRPFVPENVERQDIRELFKDLLLGRMQNQWTTRMSRVQDYIKADKFILKFVRLNGMLPWLTKNFSFRHKPVYILRHPVAVALSQIKAFHECEGDSNFEIPDVIYNEKYLLHKDFLATIKTPIERYVAGWCLHNAQNINHPRAGKDWVIVYYESLLTNPSVELHRIFSELGIEFPDQMMSEIVKPSQMVYKNDFYPQVNKQLNKWRTRISERDLQLTDRILKYFKIEIYNVNHNMPLVS
jgi:hypothetical protein